MRQHFDFLFKIATHLIAILTGVGIFVLQIGWEREISIPIGGNTLAITTILFAFLVGLGSGSEYFGRLADKIDSPWKQCGNLALLGGISILIVSIFFLPGIFGEIAYAKKSYIFSYLSRFGLSSVLIFIPTFFLGGLLPTLLKFNTKLYPLFTLGGIIGALSSAFIFIPHFGTTGTLTIAVAIFITVAITVWLLKPSENYELNKNIREKNTIKVTSRDLLLVSLPLIGFIVTSLAIIWTRALGMMIGSTTLGFSIMVTTCLVGIGMGGFLSSRFSNQIDHPFPWLSALILLAGFTAIGTSWFMNELPWWFNNLSEIAGEKTSLTLLLKFLVASIVLLPPMAIFGSLFPLSVNILSRSQTHSGRIVGRIFSLFMFGGGVGGLFTTLILIPYLGLKESIAIVTSALIFLGIIFIFRNRESIKKSAFITQGAVALIFGIVNLIAPPPWNPILLSKIKYFENEAEWIAHEDGINASVSVIDNEKENTRYLIVNGVEVLSSPIEIGPSKSNLKTQELMGILPVLLLTHRPERALVIGTGTGKTTSTILKEEGFNHIDIIEQEPVLYKMTKYFNDQSSLLFNSEDKIAEFIGDPKDFLHSGEERYHLITFSSPSSLSNISSSHFSTQFYKAVSERLTGDGIFCQWIEPENFNQNEFRAIVRTFRENFPLMILAEGGSAKDLILVGSASPLHININYIKDNLKKFSEDGEESLTYSSLLSHFLIGPNGAYKIGIGAQILSDSTPKLELGSEFEQSNLKLTREFIDNEIAKMIQTNYQSQEYKASILAQIAIDELRNLPPNRATLAKSDIIKSFITTSFENESTPEALYAYALLTDADQNEIFQNILKFKSSTPNALLIKGELALNTGDLKSAINFLSQAISKEPYMDRAYFLKAVAYQRSNKFDEAIKSYKIAAELGNSDASISLGNIHFNNNELAAAENLYKKAILLKPSSWIAWENLGKIYFKQGRRKEAIQAFHYVQLLRPGYQEPERYIAKIKTQESVDNSD